MEERDMLMKTIETLNASIVTLSENHKKEVDVLNARIKELTAQVAWLNRQLFGRKSEKLPVFDPNYPDLFAAEFADRMKQAEAAKEQAEAAKEQAEATKEQAEATKEQMLSKTVSALLRSGMPTDVVAATLNIDIETISRIING